MRINREIRAARLRVITDKGEQLGISTCSPKGGAPILFELYHNGWRGSVPLNREFKFVLISKTGEILQEKREENRCIPCFEDKAVCFDTGDVQF